MSELKLEIAYQGKTAKVDYERLEQIGASLLEAIGETDWQDNPSLKETPRRFAGFWKEFIEYDAGNINTAFESTSGAWVVVSGLRIYSVCEHHLLPFWADVTIAYKPKNKVLGLSKFARIAHMHAHKPQIQEGLGAEILETIQVLTETDFAAVKIVGKHSCMIMRGIKTDGEMTTLTLSDALSENIPHLRLLQTLL